MLTAQQAARIHAVNALVKARDEIASVRSLVCFEGPPRFVDDLIWRIDEQLSLLVPNEPVIPASPMR